MKKKIDNVTKDNENNLKHLSFEEYFESDWRQYFQEKETVQKILDAAGLSSSHDFVQINSRYIIDDNRVAVIVLIKRKNKEVLDKMIIDVIGSSPRFEQFMDVIYNIGSGCDYRLMLYDINTKHFSGGILYCDHLMSDLMDHFDGEVSMSLIGIDCIQDENNTTNIKFNKFKTITNSDQLTQKDLPDRRIFEEAEFWGPYVGSFLGGDFPCTYGFETNGINSSSIWDLGLESTWTDDNGIIVQMGIPDDAEQSFRQLLKEYNEELREAFEGCSIEFNDGVFIVKKDVPFRNFVYALPSDKIEMVEEFFRYERTVTYYVDEIFNMAPPRPNISMIKKDKSSIPNLLKQT